MIFLSPADATEAATPQPADALASFMQGLPPATLVGEQYRIDALLGYGGMGVVMRAYDQRLMRTVAIKFLQPRVGAPQTAEASLLTEARAMARVRHPNVVEIYAFGSYRDSSYFVMEYIEGQNAEHWFRKRTQGLREFIPIDEAMGVIDRCCAGVAAIHESGAVHGDLKPTNVLLADSWRVAVADFGIAMLLDGSQPRQAGGSPDYLAPEAFESLHDPAVIQRRDVYALGVMCYEFLTNELPYVGLTIDNFAHAPRNPVRPPSQIREDLPPEFDEVILRALALDPLERTASVVELRKQLHDVRRHVSDRPRERRVMIVEDDLAFAAFVKLTLEMNIPGLRVTHYASPAEALRVLEQEPIDLLISDLALPGMNGIELTSEVRARWPASKVPILVATAQGGAGDWKVLAGLGANGFLVKPVHIKPLLNAVLELLNEPSPGSRHSVRTPAC